MVKNSVGIYESNTSVATGVSGDGKVKLSCTGLDVQTSVDGFVSKRAVAAKVRGILRTTSVYHDQTKIGVSFQVRSADTFAVVTDPTTVRVVATTSSGGRNRRGTIEASIACGGTSSGICHGVVDVGDLQSSEAQDVTVQYGLKDAKLTPFAGSVSLAAAPTDLSDEMVQTVYASLPSHSLYEGDTFDLVVRSRFTAYLKTVEVQVKVGDGLEIVYGGGYPKGAAQTNGDSVFAAVLISGEGSPYTYATLAGRKDGRTPESETPSTGTDEPLFTLRIKVKSGAANLDASSVQITKLTGVRDLKSTTLSANKIGVLHSRDGWMAEDAASVHFTDDAVRGIFAYADGPAEIINTATISDQTVTAGISVRSVRSRGSLHQETGTCTSLNETVLHTKNCAAVLDGSETVGARSASIRVVVGAFTQDVPFRVHHLVADSVDLQATLTTLRPIAGWLTDDCSGDYMYQQAPVVVTARFTDGSSEDGAIFSSIDVTAFARIRSSNTAAATIGQSGAKQWVAGKAEGDVQLTVISATDDELASISITVAGLDAEDFVVLTRLDATVMTTVGANKLTQTGPFGRGTLVTVTAGPPGETLLQYEGDSTNIVVSAVFDDDSRLELTPDNGLLITTNNKATITVSSSKLQRVEVPYDPVGASGSLVRVAWIPPGNCEHFLPVSLSSKDVVLTVDPPLASSMTAALSEDFLVMKGDTATAKGADFPSAATIAVSLRFPDGVVKANRERDARVVFTVPDTAPFTVSNVGAVTALSNAVGTANVIVSFQGQNVTASVKVEVARYRFLEVTAVPEPSYPGSGAVDARRLAPLTCTDPTMYQQARVNVQMHLTNGATKLLEAQYTSLAVESTSGDDSPAIDANADRVLTPNGPGAVKIIAHFVTVESANLTVTVNDKAIDLKSIDAVTIRQGTSTITTLRGEKAVATAQLAVAATFADGRRYTTMVAKDGTPALPGLLWFRSDTPDAASVNNNRGTITLEDNHDAAVVFNVDTCTARGTEDAKVSKTASLFCNLDPVKTGDVDLGDQTGTPLKATKPGELLEVPVRVNTGGKRLQFFNLKIQYNSKQLEFVELTPQIASKDGDLQHKAAVSEDGDEGEVTYVGTISNSKVVGSSTGAELATVTFKVLAQEQTSTTASVSLAGSVVQLLDDTLGAPEVIGTENAEFEAGDVTVLVDDGRRRFKQRRRQRSVRASSLPAKYGDANCDGKFDGKDPVFILNFVGTAAEADTGIPTELGKIVQADLSKCRGDRGLAADDATFMDSDGDASVGTPDLLYLLDILAGNFYFMAVDVTSSTEGACQFGVSVALSNSLGESPKAGTRILLDFTYTEDAFGFEALDQAIRDSTKLVTTDKGDNALHGGLLSATASAGGTFDFEFAEHGLSSFAGVGLSLIQIGSGKVVSGTQWTFFAGSNASPLFERQSLTYSAASLQTTFPLEMPAGFEPRLRGVEMTCNSTTTATTSAATSTIATNATTVATTPALTTTTTTIFDPENVDCVEKQDDCTGSCEDQTARNYVEITAAAKNGKACNGPSPCQPGQGECPNPGICTETASGDASDAKDAKACADVAELDTGDACEIVETAADDDGNTTACTYISPPDPPVDPVTNDGNVTTAIPDIAVGPSPPPGDGQNNGNPSDPGGNNGNPATTIDPNDLVVDGKSTTAAVAIDVDVDDNDGIAGLVITTLGTKASGSVTESPSQHGDKTYVPPGSGEDGSGSVNNTGDFDQKEVSAATVPVTIVLILLIAGIVMAFLIRRRRKNTEKEVFNASMEMDRVPRARNNSKFEISSPIAETAFINGRTADTAYSDAEAFRVRDGEGDGGYLVPRAMGLMNGDGESAVGGTAAASVGIAKTRAAAVDESVADHSIYPMAKASCTECKVNISKENKVVDPVDQAMYCKSCWDALNGDPSIKQECSECKCVLTTDTKVVDDVDGAIYCKNCWQELSEGLSDDDVYGLSNLPEGNEGDNSRYNVLGSNPDGASDVYDARTFNNNGLQSLTGHDGYSHLPNGDDGKQENVYARLSKNGRKSSRSSLRERRSRKGMSTDSTGSGIYADVKVVRRLQGDASATTGPARGSVYADPVLLRRRSDVWDGQGEALDSEGEDAYVDPVLVRQAAQAKAAARAASGEVIYQDPVILNARGGQQAAYEMAGSGGSIGPPGNDAALYSVANKSGAQMNHSQGVRGTAQPLTGATYELAGQGNPTQTAGATYDLAGGGAIQPPPGVNYELAGPGAPSGLQASAMYELAGSSSSTMQPPLPHQEQHKQQQQPAMYEMAAATLSAGSRPGSEPKYRPTYEKSVGIVRPTSAYDGSTGDEQSRPGSYAAAALLVPTEYAEAVVAPRAEDEEYLNVEDPGEDDGADFDAIGALLKATAVSPPPKFAASPEPLMQVVTAETVVARASVASAAGEGGGRALKSSHVVYADAEVEDDYLGIGEDDVPALQPASPVPRTISAEEKTLAGDCAECLVKVLEGEEAIDEVDGTLYCQSCWALLADDLESDDEGPDAGKGGDKVKKLGKDKSDFEVPTGSLTARGPGWHRGPAVHALGSSTTTDFEPGGAGANPTPAPRKVDAKLKLPAFGGSSRADGVIAARLESTAKHTYAARSARELSFQAGDTLTIVETIDSNWFKGKNAEGKTGYIAAAYITTPTSAQPATAPSSFTTRRASLAERRASASTGKMSGALVLPKALNPSGPPPIKLGGGGSGGGADDADESFDEFGGFGDGGDVGGGDEQHQPSADDFLSPTALATPTWLSSSRNGRRTSLETPTMVDVPGGAFTFDEEDTEI
jgi:hypothetical protein